MYNPFSKRDEEPHVKQELAQAAMDKAEMLYQMKQEAQEKKVEENVPLTMPEEKDDSQMIYAGSATLGGFSLTNHAIQNMSMNLGSSIQAGQLMNGTNYTQIAHDEADPKEEKGLKKRIMPIGEIALVDGHKVSDEGALAMSKALGIPVIIMEDLTSMEFASIDQVEEALKQAKATLATKTQENV